MKEWLLQLTPSIPEVFLLTMACVILLARVFVKHQKNLSYILALFSLVIAAWLTGATALEVPAFEFQSQYIVDNAAVLMKIAVYVLVFLTFIYSKRYVNERDIQTGEYYVLGLFATLGMQVLISAHHLLILYLGLELLSLPLYAMVALERDNARAVEAAMKFFVMGAIASGLLLYGISLIFCATQALDIDKVALAITQNGVQHHLILVLGLVMVLAAIAFKLGAAPFHVWVPDVYDGAPSSVTLFISAAPKVAAFGLILRLLLVAMTDLQVEWQQILMVMGVLSIAIGNIVAISQTNIKRLLAYSSIAHMGYAILGLACATPRGYGAALFYIITYSIMSLGAFGLLVMMSQVNFEADNIDDLKGLNTRNPWLAFMMLLVMFSMAGVPPLVGFMAKVGILEALIKAHFVGLAILAIIFSIIGSYYYLRVVKVMYFEEPDTIAPVLCTMNEKMALSLNGLAVLLLGILPGALFTVCHNLF
ncbi:MAG TPA: NADH-quinone oxidoreductase subunit NuoN [Coxiellaceae bacterium]|nr:NADH-quinone oxidoreductase subunit NuoN [Coxiellaceae bacterium]